MRPRLRQLGSSLSYGADEGCYAGRIGTGVRMIPGYLLGLREGLEAALILGVTFGVLNRMRRSELAPAAWRGVAVAVAISVLAALVLFSVGARLEGRPEQIFEGVTMLLAAGILTWMILWMGVYGREVSLVPESEREEGKPRPP